MADRTLLDLLREQEKNAFYLTYYVRGMIRHDKAAEAEPILDRLAAVSDRPAEVAEIKARVLHALGKKDEAYREAEKSVKAKGARPDLSALLLEQLGRPEEAGKLLRAFVAGSKDPRPRLLLAQHLARRGDVAGAVKLCDASWRDCPPELVAQVSLAVAREPKATEAQRGEIASRLRDASDKAPRSTTLLVVLAALQDLRGKEDEAVARYRAALEQAPKNVLALNNLAYLLALKGGHEEEAIELIDRAIDEQGPHTELLDTKGVACMKAKRIDLARQLLRQAVEMEPSASKYLHLAQAHDLAGDRREARRAYDKAKEIGLASAVLHPLEKPAIDKLIAAMEGAKE